MSPSAESGRSSMPRSDGQRSGKCSGGETYMRVCRPDAACLLSFLIFIQSQIQEACRHQSLQWPLRFWPVDSTTHRDMSGAVLTFQFFRWCWGADASSFHQVFPTEKKKMVVRKLKEGLFIQCIDNCFFTCLFNIPAFLHCNSKVYKLLFF